jgi:energy-coupling factor transport system permease protein
MALIDDLTLGRFVAGDSLLHRTDVPCKLILFAGLVVAAFALPELQQLAGLGILAAALISFSGVGLRIWWRGLSAFRWLFLFTILLHVLLSPGHTLWGVEFLSRDGLVHGLTVVVRLALAVTFSSLLTLTSSPPALARGIGSLLAPFERVGLPSSRIAEMLFLSLHFIPLLREEMLAAGAARRRNVQGPAAPLQWARSFRDLVTPVILQMVERADTLAWQLATGREILPADDVCAEQGRFFNGLILLGITFLWITLLVWLW